MRATQHETRKTAGIEMAKAGVGCFATIVAAVIGGIFLLVSTKLQAKTSTPVPTAEPTATEEALCTGVQAWFSRSDFPEAEIGDC